MSKQVKILCEYTSADLEKQIEIMFNSGWRVVNAFHRDGKAFGWCALLVKEDDEDKHK